MPQGNLYKMKYLLLILKTIGVILLVLFSFGVAFAIDMDVIKHLESRGNPLASNKGHYGLYQISEMCLKDFNRANKTHYAKRHLFIPSVNERVALWYFGRIKQMLRYYKLPTTLVYQLASYNWGIGSVLKWHKKGGGFEKLPRETRRYIVAYVRRLK